MDFNLFSIRIVRVEMYLKLNFFPLWVVFDISVDMFDFYIL